MEIYDRINKIRNDLFKSNIDFADALGEKPNTTSNWISGKRNIGLDVIEKILIAFPNIDANWLIMGSGEMLKSSEVQNIEVSSDVVALLKEQLKEKDIEIKKLNKEVARLELLLEQHSIDHARKAM